MTSPVPEPGALTIDAGGAMDGRTGAYEKRLGDMTGVYRDADAFASAVAERGADHLVYRVEEHRAGDGPGALIIGTSTLAPGRYGDEFAMTRGHLHAKADRAELYHCLRVAASCCWRRSTGAAKRSSSAPGTPRTCRGTGCTAASTPATRRS